MPAPARLLLPALLACAAAAADPGGQTPLMVQIGPTYLSQDLRSALDGDWGVHAEIGAMLLEHGLLGMPTADLDLRYASGGGSSFTAFSTTYAERQLIDDHWWLGAGLGAEYLRVKVATRADPAAGVAATSAEERKWTVGGKGMLGFLVTRRCFIEGTYHWSRPLMGMDTSSISIGLGYWF